MSASAKAVKKTPAPLTATTAQAEVAQFYARHFHLLDSGYAEEWAATFTDDGAFWPPQGDTPVVGRQALAEAVATAHSRLAEQHVQRRHWHGMVDVRQFSDTELAVRCYAQILSTTRGGATELLMSCICEDVFTRRDGELFIQERRVTRDDVEQ